jgi:hypothetical protein
MNAVRGRTGLGRFGGVLIPSMAVDEHVDVGEYCVAVSVQYGIESNRPGVRGTLTSGRPYAHWENPMGHFGEISGFRDLPCCLGREVSKNRGRISNQGITTVRATAGIPSLRLGLFVISVVGRAVRISVPANSRSRNFEH